MIDKAVRAKLEEEETAHEGARVKEDIVVASHVAWVDRRSVWGMSMAVSYGQETFVLYDACGEEDRHDCFDGFLLSVSLRCLM